jgi:hypothetical protein
MRYPAALTLALWPMLRPKGSLKLASCVVTSILLSVGDESLMEKEAPSFRAGSVTGRSLIAQSSAPTMRATGESAAIFEAPKGPNYQHVDKKKNWCSVVLHNCSIASATPLGQGQNGEFICLA